jgi:hypothetical protein
MIMSLVNSRWLDADLLRRAHFSGEHVGILRASIACRLNESRFTESRCPKFRKEGAALFGSGDSSEPICFARLELPQIKLPSVSTRQRRRIPSGARRAPIPQNFRP